MASPLPTKLLVIAPAIQAQLVSATGLDASSVRLVARDGVPKLDGDSDILIRIAAPSPVPGFSHGAGRSSVEVERLVQVTIRVRHAADVSDGDDYLLSDAEYGIWQLEDIVLDALHIWVPTNPSTSDWYLSCPMEWVPGGNLVRDAPVSQSWGHSDLMFKITYQQPVPTSNGF